MANDAEPQEDAVSAETIRDELLKQLWISAGRNELKGIALVQGIKALAQLVPPPPPDDPDAGKPFSVVDQLDSLPKKEGQRLLRQEIGRLREEVASLEAALVATEGK